MALGVAIFLSVVLWLAVTHSGFRKVVFVTVGICAVAVGCYAFWHFAIDAPAERRKAKQEIEAKEKIDRERAKGYTVGAPTNPDGLLSPEETKLRLGYLQLPENSIPTKPAPLPLLEPKVSITLQIPCEFPIDQLRLKTDYTGTPNLHLDLTCSYPSKTFDWTLYNYDLTYKNENAPVIAQGSFRSTSFGISAIRKAVAEYH